MNKHTYSLLIQVESFFEVLLFPPDWTTGLTGMFELGAGPQCISPNNIPGMTNLTCSERHHHHPQHHHHQRGRHSPGFTLRRQSDPKHGRRFCFPTAGVKVDSKQAAEDPTVPSAPAPNDNNELLWHTCDGRRRAPRGPASLPSKSLFCCQVKLALRGHAPHLFIVQLSANSHSNPPAHLWEEVPLGSIGIVWAQKKHNVAVCSASLTWTKVNIYLLPLTSRLHVSLLETTRQNFLCAHLWLAGVQTSDCSLKPLWLQVKFDLFYKSFGFNQNRNVLFYSFMNFNELLQMLYFSFSLENQLILVCDVISDNLS